MNKVAIFGKKGSISKYDLTENKPIWVGDITPGYKPDIIGQYENYIIVFSSTWAGSKMVHCFQEDSGNLLWSHYQQTLHSILVPFIPHTYENHMYYLASSKEVAKLCAIMASEMGIDPKMAKRAGLLHDMGKVPSIEKDIETPHALLGMQWAEKFGEKPDVCNAIGAHHDEIEMNCLISPIIQVCDAISGARPGARRQVLDSYIERLKNLEEIALDFNGVEKAYAIQAGRELRVIVESDKINDDEASNLSFQISQKIQTDMTYPGQVKVTVIRETRSVNIAK